MNNPSQLALLLSRRRRELRRLRRRFRGPKYHQTAPWLPPPSEEWLKRNLSRMRREYLRRGKI